MSKVSIGKDEYEVADLMAYQQFSLWLYELVLDAMDGNNDKLVEDLKEKISNYQMNIDWLNDS